MSKKRPLPLPTCIWNLGYTLIGLLCLLAHEATRAQSLPAQTPPMGWNSWNHFGAAVSDVDVRRAADALIAAGLRDRGYLYVNIDDGWQGKRTAAGVLQPNDRFPDMAALSEYVHNRGLRLGLYSSPGPTTCAGRPGSAGFEEQDARSFAAWHVDYLKYDLCSYRKVIDDKAEGDLALKNALLREGFQKMHDALQRTGRPMVFSISEHGLDRGWTWAAQVGANSWRTGDDIRDSYLSVTEIGFAQAGLGRFAGPGHWNDPDMLEIGNGGLSLPEAQTQMSLWALLAAPLLAGNDLNQMSAETLSVLSNEEVIGIDQDRAGHAADRLWSEGPEEIWGRNLADGSYAVGFFNRNQGSIMMSFDPSLVRVRGMVKVRDVWQHKWLKPLISRTSIEVPSHGVVLLVFHYR